MILASLIDERSSWTRKENKNNKRKATENYVTRENRSLRWGSNREPLQRMHLNSIDLRTLEFIKYSISIKTNLICFLFESSTTRLWKSQDLGLPRFRPYFQKYVLINLTYNTQFYYFFLVVRLGCVRLTIFPLPIEYIGNGLPHFLRNSLRAHNHTLTSLRVPLFASPSPSVYKKIPYNIF